MNDPQKTADETANVALEALYVVIDELNGDLAEDKKLTKSPQAQLFGGDDGLESIDLVRLIVLYEMEIASRADCAISISDDRAMSEARSHFSTVGSLAAYATSLIEEERAGG